MTRNLNEIFTFMNSASALARANDLSAVYTVQYMMPHAQKAESCMAKQNNSQAAEVVLFGRFFLVLVTEAESSREVTNTASCPA
jgi:hypothetical protein